jgi:hypothetical protein
MILAGTRVREKYFPLGKCFEIDSSWSEKVFLMLFAQKLYRAAAGAGQVVAALAQLVRAEEDGGRDEDERDARDEAANVQAPHDNGAGLGIGAGFQRAGGARRRQRAAFFDSLTIWKFGILRYFQKDKITFIGKSTIL